MIIYYLVFSIALFILLVREAARKGEYLDLDDFNTICWLAFFPLMNVLVALVLVVELMESFRKKNV